MENSAQHYNSILKNGQVTAGNENFINSQYLAGIGWAWMDYKCDRGCQREADRC